MSNFNNIACIPSAALKHKSKKGKKYSTSVLDALYKKCYFTKAVGTGLRSGRKLCFSNKNALIK